MKFHRNSAYWKPLLLKAFPLALLFVLGLTNLSWGEPLSLPNISLSIGGKADQPEKVATVIQLLFLLTVLSLAPAILLMLTSFTPDCRCSFPSETGHRQPADALQSDHHRIVPFSDLLRHVSRLAEHFHTSYQALLR